MHEIESRVLTEAPTLVIWTKTRIDGIPAFLGRAYGEVARYAENAEAKLAGPPFARYRMLSDPDGEFEIEAGFPLATPIEGSAEVEASTLPGGMAAVTVHIGPYEAMEPAYAAINTWIAEHGGRENGPAWEVYYSDPVAQPDPSTWRTEIFQPYVMRD